MEKIDLTKCVNCRFRAKVDGKNDYGRICVENADTGLAFLRSDLENGYIATWHCDAPTIEGICGRKVTDFEIVPRDPETYKDWQVGDNVHYPNGDNDIVIFRSGELVVLADDFTEENSDVTAVNTCSQLFDRREGRLVLTDIEQQIIAEKKVVEGIPKPYEFKKGEPVLVRDHERNRWRIAAYSGEDSVSFLADTGKSVVHWKYCLPYNERTMHLLGTSEDYKEGE